MRKMIDFQHKLNIWKSKKIDQQQFNLDSIFNASSRRNIFLHTMRLSPGHRFALIEDIVDYFVRRKIPFTLPIREDLTRQICRRFKSEIPVSHTVYSNFYHIYRIINRLLQQWYYSDDGLASGGQDQLYQHYLQVSLKAGTGNSGLKVASVESLAPNDETAGSSEAAKSTPMPPQKSPTVVNAPIKPHLVRVVLPARQAVPIGQFRSSNAAVAPAAAASAAAATTATPLQLRPQSLAAPPPNILRTSPMMALPPVKLPPISVRLSSRLMAPPAAKPSPKPNETGNNMIRAVVGQQALKLSQQLAKRLLPVRRASVAEERPRILTKVTTVSGESYVIRNMDAVKRPANGFRVLNANAPPPKVQRVEAPVIRPQTPPAPEIPEPQSDPLGSDDDDDDEHSDSDGTRSASPVGDEPSAAAEEDEGEQMAVGENGDDIAEIRPEAQETVTFLKAELFQTDLAESLGSLTEVNKNIVSTSGCLSDLKTVPIIPLVLQLSLEFEQQLGLENRFRDDEFCKTYTKQFSGVLLRSSRFSIDEKHFSQQSLSKQMTLALFLLPAALNPSMSFVFRGKMISNFISVCSSVQDFVSSLPRPSRGPYVAIIGKLLAPVSYVLYYQKKVYRFVELWHALDMAIKIHITYKVHMIADSANAWQFVMLHFYQMEKDVEFVYPSVKTLQAFLCLH